MYMFFYDWSGIVSWVEEVNINKSKAKLNTHSGPEHLNDVGTVYGCVCLHRVFGHRRQVEFQEPQVVEAANRTAKDVNEH